MKKARKRTVALALALLCVLSIEAASAQASFTPVRGNVTGTAADAAWNFGYVCPRADLTGTVTSATTISASLTFSPNGRQPCVNSNNRAIMTWVCRGTATFTSTSSVAGVSATGTFSLDSGFACTVNIPISTCTYTISGPQGPFSSWTFDQSTQRLTVSILTGGITVTTTGLPVICGPSPTTWTFTATYALSTRLTIS